MTEIQWEDNKLYLGHNLTNAGTLAFDLVNNRDQTTTNITREAAKQTVDVLNKVFNFADSARKKPLLVIVDVQNDFVSGSLAVPDAKSAIPEINKLAEAISSVGGTIAKTADAHPKNHCSFIQNGGIWPEHCVQGTTGNLFHADVYYVDVTKVFLKGLNPNEEQYSAFNAINYRTSSTLGAFADKFSEIFVVGLAFDYCVKETAIDFAGIAQVSVATSATRAVTFGTAIDAAIEMLEEGVILEDSVDDLIKRIYQDYA